MSYSGENTAREARKTLGQALGALQEDPDIPDDVMAVAQNIAQAVGALYEAERASSDVDGKASIRSALGSLSQTLALLQDVRTAHKGIEVATEVIAGSMSKLYPLTQAPTMPPPAGVSKNTARFGVPKAPAVPKDYFPPIGSVADRTVREEDVPRENLEVNIGATTESNFYVGFSGEVAEGGVFLCTYETLPKGTRLNVLVTLPGGFQFETKGTVRFVRDPLDFGADSEPGMGVDFENLDDNSRALVLRFIRKRAPIFYDE